MIDPKKWPKGWHPDNPIDIRELTWLKYATSEDEELYGEQAEQIAKDRQHEDLGAKENE